MTVAVAVADGDSVVMGLDSCASAGGTLIDCANKVPASFPCGLLIAVSGLHSIANEVAHGWTPPEPAADADGLTYLRTVAVSLRSHFTAEPVWTLTKERAEGKLDGYFLAAWRGVVALIGDDFSVCPPRSGEAAIGSGRDFALGALQATTGKPAEERVRIALEAAAYFQEDVAAPFTIMRTGGR